MSPTLLRAGGCIGLIASIISIFAFLTPWPNVWTFANSLHSFYRPGEPVAVQTAPEPEEKRANLSEFTPLAWMPPQSDNVERIYAVRPAGLLSWFSPATLVSLECDISHQCKVTPLFPLPSDIKSADAVIFDENRNIAVLDREGDGLLYRAYDRKYVTFHFSLPCAKIANPSNKNDNTGNYAIANGGLFDNYLSFVINGQGCKGDVQIADRRIDIGVNFDNGDIANTFYAIQIEIEFDRIGYVKSANSTLLNANYGPQAPPLWFKYTSVRPRIFTMDAATIVSRKRNDEIISNRQNAVISALKSFQRENVYIYPNIPNIMKFNAYLTGFTSKFDLLGVINDSEDGSGTSATFFTTDGIVSRSEWGIRHLTYEEIRSRSVKDDIYVVEYDGFYLPARDQPLKETVKNAVANVLNATASPRYPISTSSVNSPQSGK